MSTIKKIIFMATLASLLGGIGFLLLEDNQTKINPDIFKKPVVAKKKDVTRLRKGQILSLKDVNTSETLELSNEEIDLIFIGFNQEADEKRERLKKEKNKIKVQELLKKKSIARVKKRNTPQRKVLPHGTKKKVKNYPKNRVLRKPIRVAGLKINKVEIKILGIVCSDNACQAITKDKTLSVGNKVSGDETIVSITKSFVKTTKRTINF